LKSGQIIFKERVKRQNPGQGEIRDENAWLRSVLSLLGLKLQKGEQVLGMINDKTKTDTSRIQ